MWAGNRRRTVHASLVILVIDDFTGKPVRDSSVRLSIPGQRPPLVKEDGYRVFLDLAETDFNLVCESGIYGRREERVELSGWTGKEVMVLRIYPNACYPAPSGAVRVSGRTQPGRRLLFWGSGESGYRLLRDYECSQNEKIAIYNPENKMLAGKKFFICGREGGQKEYFKIVEEMDDYYSMQNGLRKGYKKVGSRIVPVCEVCADGDGAFFLLASGGGRGQTELFCRAEGDEEEKKFLLAAGKANAIVL